MTGIRTVVGFGQVTREHNGEKTSMSQLPMNAGKLRNKPSAIIMAKELGERFGAAVTLTLDRSRDVEYRYDLGMRDVSVTSPGMYELGFSLEGYVSVTNLGWLKYLFHTQEIELEDTTPLYDKDCVLIDDLSAHTGDVYLKNARGRLIKSGLPAKEFEGYLDFLDESTDGKVKVIYCDYPESPDKTMFDIGYVQSNTRAMGGVINEVGILCGCMIESGTVSYEAGSDYGVKFTLNGFALRDYLETTSDELYYQDFIRKIDSDILAVGCLSVAQRSGDELKPISYVDSASFTVNNTLDKIPECNEVTYGGATIGTIAYELDAQTYSNDPNRYINAMMGYENDFANQTIDNVSDMANVYWAQRQPRKVRAFKIRSSDDYGGRTLGKFLDILMFQNVVTGLNKDFDVDNRLMDNPTIVPLRAMMVYGYLESDIKKYGCEIEDDDDDDRVGGGTAGGYGFPGFGDDDDEEE